MKTTVLVTALIIVLSTAANIGAQTQTGAATAAAAVLSEAMAYRSVWMGDSTRFDACSVFNALGRPAGFPEGISPNVRGLLDRASDPCPPAATFRAAADREVRVDDVAVSDTTATLRATVRIGDKFHHERYGLQRSASGWHVREVAVSGAMSAVVRLPAHPGGEFGPRDTALRPLVVVDGIPRSEPSPDTRGTPDAALTDIRPEDIEAVEIVKGPSAVALYGPAAEYGAILIRRRRPAQSASPIPASPRAALVNAVLLHRIDWMNDSTRVEACSVERALASPADFPASIDARYRALLTTTEKPCAAAPHPAPASELGDPAWRKVARVDSVSVADSIATVYLGVSHGEQHHSEAYTLVRGRSGGWWVNEVRQWGFTRTYYIRRPPIQRH
ncbi:MAG: TonB-dependent receptor [Gemmatimonadetes bacterium]|nr:TonB-dependent receptor [Gemmatimonadota bacterium]